MRSQARFLRYLHTVLPMAGVTKLPFPVKEIPTPSLLVNLDRVKQNVSTMINRCRTLRLKLRPHMKTSKCLEAGALATGGTRRCIVVSTLAEAEFFADGGFDDITYAMIFTANKLPRLKTLSERLSQFHVVVETEDAVDLLEASPLEHKPWSVYMFVDTGDKREGALWDAESTLALGKHLADSGHIEFRGVYTHEGHCYNVTGRKEIEAIADQTTDRLLLLSQRLKQKGVICEELGFGATPTGSYPGVKVKQLTELHPGNYVFYDLMQRNIGSCSTEDIAVTVATRVIGQYATRGQILIDAGWTALSKQGPLPNGSYTEFKGHPNLRLVSLNQELGLVEVGEGSSVRDYPCGTLLHMYPYHACATSAMHREYFVQEADEVTGIWRPCGGW